MKNIEQIKAIIFDMDGVLIDSMLNHVRAWTKAFRENNYPVVDKDIQTLSGVPAFETVAILSKLKKIPYDKSIAEKIIARKIEIKNQLPVDIPYTLCGEIMKILKKTGYRLSVVSGSTRENITLILKKFFPNIFEFFVSVNDTKKGKPHPEPFLRALRLYNQNNGRFEPLAPSGCLVIEDGIPGLQGAKAAGMPTVGIASTVKADELTEHCDLVVSDHQELLSFIKSLG